MGFVSTEVDGAPGANVCTESDATMRHAAALLSLPSADALRGALCTRQLAMGGREVMTVPMNTQQQHEDEV